MKFLIKDLSEMTGFSPARIRKWQERYHILNPVAGPNGYYYYDNDDLKILLYIKEELAKGRPLKEILKTPREVILSKDVYYHDFTTDELKFIDYIIRYQYNELEKHLDAILKSKNFLSWIKEIHRLILLSGKAWEKNFITIADEHSFSNWLRGYILKYTLKKMKYQQPVWLVAIYPGDNHELGALLHFSKLLHYGVPAKYVGTLPKAELIREIKMNPYRYVSISVVLPRKKKELENLKKDILKVRECKVLFGGYGYKLMKEQNKKGAFV